jgi:GrpB-like predicted nucleotidyltransferase (UPF0157 family)
MRAVELHSHDPAWAVRAGSEAARLQDALGGLLRGVHHVGSTAVPGLVAKPIVDLVAEVASIDALDAHRDALARLGYRWRGENGQRGRRYFTLDDDSVRAVHLHVFATGSPEVARHVAFRNHLRADAALATAYADEKARCQRLHPDDSGAYSECKSDWIAVCEARITAAAQAFTE